jgi:GalNAc-alpha-(1->4)-GalNAc-alpha-(1->3)-diNAcBac-PP-undecaprenol alpha-1,4-N-acetyl-D-galactosaminyltransferase
MHTIKDVGQIWQYVAKAKWLKSEVWGLEDNAMSFEVNNQKWIWFKSIIKMYIHLIKNAKKIKVLHTYHIYRYSFITAILFKILNKSWKLYIKLDQAFINGKHHNYKLFDRIPRIVLIVLFKVIDYISFEDKRFIDYLNIKFPQFSKKYLFITNWFEKIGTDISIIKENIIVCSWRMWVAIKNYELIMKLLRDKRIYNEIRNWKIILLWPYTDEFKVCYNQLLKTQPNLKEKLILRGMINNKNELYKIMSCAKIFLHPSFWEWDSLVQYEAMYTWCYMLCWDVGNILQNYPKWYIKIFDQYSVNSLRENLLNTIEELSKLKNPNNYYRKLHQYALDHYPWEKVLQPLISII